MHCNIEMMFWLNGHPEHAVNRVYIGNYINNEGNYINNEGKGSNPSSAGFSIGHHPSTQT